MNRLKAFPDQNTLLSMYPYIEVLNVNSHIHTPYSFSAFNTIPEIFRQAVNENIALLGINDFFVADGYDSFCEGATNNSIFPLFNIEFIGLLKEQQQSGIRINDPNNPGRCYFCGKGLDYPFRVGPDFSEKLNHVIYLGQEQVRAMIERLNDIFRITDPEINFSYENIRSGFAKNLVRERHLAKAVRVAIYEKYRDNESRIQLFERLFEKSPEADLADLPGIENEIRSNLLKAGGRAFVEEDENTFLQVEEIIRIINNAGGIPCYPVLLDDKKGNYTEFEQSSDSLLYELSQRKISCIELIPGRNDASHLEKFVNFFYERNFIVLMGTEHNTPELAPLTCDTRGRKPLSANMKRIAYEGACAVAAHQYLRAIGEQGYTISDRMPDKTRTEYFIRLGNALIHSTHNQKFSLYE
jgi:hypothetical protein